MTRLFTPSCASSFLQLETTSHALLVPIGINLHVGIPDGGVRTFGVAPPSSSSQQPRKAFLSWLPAQGPRKYPPLSDPLPSFEPTPPFRATSTPPPTEITTLPNGARIISEAAPVSAYEFHAPRLANTHACAHIFYILRHTDRYTVYAQVCLHLHVRTLQAVQSTRHPRRQHIHIHTHTHKHTHTHIHTDKHTDTHTHTCTHTHTYTQHAFTNVPQTRFPSIPCPFALEPPTGPNVQLRHVHRLREHL